MNLMVLRRMGMALLTWVACQPEHVGGQETEVRWLANDPAWGKVELREEVRIGTLTGSEDYVLGRVGGLAVAEDGDIWVADRHAAALRRYDVNGEFLGQVGRRGEGPGEFRYPGQMRRLPDDRIAVWDDGLLRVSLFQAKTAAFSTSFRVPTYMIRGPFQEFEVDNKGHFYIAGSNQLTDPDAPTRWYWLKLNPDGMVLDSIAHAPANQDGLVDPTRTYTALSPSGFRVIGRNDQFSFTITEPAGRVVKLEQRREPTPYSREEREEKQELEDFRAQQHGRAPREIPRYKPLFTALEIDSEGRLWVAVSVASRRVSVRDDGGNEDRQTACRRLGLTDCQMPPAVEWDQPLVYDVISSQGQYLARVEFPNDRTDVVFSSGMHVWVVELGAFDEPYVVRYRILRERDDLP